MGNDATLRLTLTTTTKVPLVCFITSLLAEVAQHLLHRLVNPLFLLEFFKVGLWHSLDALFSAVILMNLIPLAAIPWFVPVADAFIIIVNHKCASSTHRLLPTFRLVPSE